MTENELYNIPESTSREEFGSSEKETERRHLKGLDLIGVELEKEGSRIPGELTTRRTNI